MGHSHSTCPICNNPIQDRSLEQCDRCGWTLAVESLLEPKYYDLLLDWGSRSYDRIFELESRGSYRQDRLDQRLNSQRDDIHRLETQIKILCDRVPAIKSILESNLARTELEDNATKTSIDSTLVMESNPIENNNLSNSNEESLNSPIDLQIKAPVVSSINSIYGQSDRTDSYQIYQSINSIYYHNANDFASKYNTITVSVNKESIERNRGNEDKTVIFEENTRGNYWLFTINEISYLVPVADKYINQHSYTTTALSFDCHSYTPDYQKIQLKKPAIVSIESHTNYRTWQLQERGELVFL
jgi:hypothetical protein